jgi:protein-disulfide isomerase
MTRRMIVRLTLIASITLLAFPSLAQEDNASPALGEIGGWFRDIMGLEGASTTTVGQPDSNSFGTNGQLTGVGVYGDIPQSRGEDGAFILGDPDAPITVIEFADFACPHCQRYKEVMDQFIEDYVRSGQARFQFRTFPTAGGQLTYYAGQIAECAEEQLPGAFWAAHEYYYELGTSGLFNEQVGRNLARELDLDAAALETCVATAEQVDRDIAFGRAMGIGGTPGVLIQYGNDQPEFISVDGVIYDAGGVPYEVLEQALDAGRA